MKKPTLTLDTSCIISLLRVPEDSTSDDELKALKQIQQWGIDARIEISISEKSRTEALRNKKRAQEHDPNNELRFEKWQQTLNILDNYQPTKSRWLLGLSEIGRDAGLGAHHESDDHLRLSQLLFNTSPNNLKEGDAFDLAILFEHLIQKNDLFVTRDRKNNILKKKSEMKINWNIVVCSPIEATQILFQLFEKDQ